MSDTPNRDCPDCHVPPGQPHDDGCDTARCTSCGEQRITCKHGGSDIGWGQIWNGPADAAARVRQLEARLWENSDAREMPVSAVCHSIANNLRIALAGDNPTGTTSPAAEALLVAFDETQLAEMHAAASARIKRVRALHQREYEACSWCSTNDRYVDWPCPTISALNGEEQP